MAWRVDILPVGQAGHTIIRRQYVQPVFNVDRFLWIEPRHRCHKPTTYRWIGWRIGRSAGEIWYFQIVRINGYVPFIGKFYKGTSMVKMAMCKYYSCRLAIGAEQ